MNSTIITVCKTHVPNKSAISEIEDSQFTFCESCESNIERYYYDSDPEQFPTWTKWEVSK